MSQCEDDCTSAERVEDERNALWGTEIHCITRAVLLSGSCNMRLWQYAGGGLDSYTQSPGIWAALLRALEPGPQPMTEHEECVYYSPHPEACEEYDPLD